MGLVVILLLLLFIVVVVLCIVNDRAIQESENNKSDNYEEDDDTVIEKVNTKREEHGYKCPACDCDIKEEFEYCPSCGIELEINIEELNKCPECKKELSSTMKWCPYCGERLTDKYHQNQMMKNSEISETNSKALLGFILSLVALFVNIISFISFYLCIRAIDEINKKGQNGKGIAIAGIVISALFILKYIYVIIGLLLYS